MDITKLFDLQYIFLVNPAPLKPLQWGLAVGVFGLLVVVAIIAVIWSRKKEIDITTKKVATKISTFAFTLGLTGWVLFFLRQTHVYFFSRRFLFLFWLIGFIVWLVFLLKYVVKKAPKARQDFTERQEFEKYLPKKKK
ncbi:hypothetical protein HQ544_04010 [Candidatus Falkowbacteria bacterium]|nr:hypothetical protein [Candidatus Falkowbacteria bacterium]